MIESHRAVTNLKLTVRAVETHLMTVGELAALHVHTGKREHQIDLLRAVLVVHARRRDRQPLDQVVERLFRLVRVGERPRQIVPAVGVDEIVDIDALDRPGLDDVAAAKQLPQAQVELRATKWSRTPARRATRPNGAGRFADRSTA